MIDVKNLSFKYNKNAPLVLDGLSFSCEKGSVNVLLGLNGSGKSTLIKILVGLLVGLLDKYQGDVFLDDKNIKETSIKERSKIMSYVSQRTGLIDDFLVRDYLLFGKINKLNFYQTPNDEDKESVIYYAEKLDITHLLDKKLGELSGGERQIVSICCALVQNTKLIVLDEPTAALDIKNQHKVLSLLKDIARDEEKTIVLSSHNPNHALFLDGNVFCLQDGKIVEEGIASKVIAIEKLKAIYGEKIIYSKNLPYDEISFSN